MPRSPGPPHPAPGSGKSPRRLAVAALVAGLVLLGLARLPWRGVYVKVVNRTNQPMTGVSLVLGGGRRLSLPPIPAGQSSGAYIGHGDTSNFRLVYTQPDGTVNGLLGVGFSPVMNLTCSDKIVLGIMAHRTNGDPRTMRYYVGRRRRYDLSPEAGDFAD